METWIVALGISAFRFKLILALQLAMVLTSSPCQTQEGPAGASSEAERIISLGAEADMNSKYIWRGIVFENRPVVQPSVWASARNFTLSIWNNHVPGRETGVGIGDEIDFILTYEQDWQLFSSELEFGYYLYPGDDESPATGELTVSFSRSMGLFSASTAHVFDLLEYRGSYYGEASLSVEREMARGLTLQTRAFTGWASAKFNETYAGVWGDALNLAGLEGTATWRIAGPLYVRPHVETYFTLDRTIAEATQHHITSAGLAIGVD